MSDDAYITLRTVDNLVNGYGPRWNVAERVQAFTHPLWMFVMAGPYAITREAFLTPLAVSIAFAAVAIWTCLRQCRAAATILVVASVLIFSKAFVEYSTSGLENPLAFLLLALFVAREGAPPSARKAHWLWALAGLVMLTRLDLGLMVLPALLWHTRQVPWSVTVRAASAGMAPLVAWEVFSVVYYGFPFPNTAYAKLQNGIPAGELAAQGLLYLLDTVQRDPVSMIGVAGGTVAALAADPRGNGAMAAGIMAYLVYVIRIGGDFMTGRFVAAPLLVASCLLGRSAIRIPTLAATAVAAAVCALGIYATARPPILTGRHTFDVQPRDIYGVGGIDDERAFYSRYTGLLRYTRALPLPHNVDVQAGKDARGKPQIRVSQSIGFFGFFAGPALHVVDPLALTDPLLARLPPTPTKQWRIGHFERPIPAGYVATLESGRNVIEDPSIARFYDDLALITRGPLWSRARWRAIIAANVRNGGR
jgi:arabinofuranosyltransferase